MAESIDFADARNRSSRGVSNILSRSLSRNLARNAAVLGGRSVNICWKLSTKHVEVHKRRAKPCASQSLKSRRWNFVLEQEHFLSSGKSTTSFPRLHRRRFIRETETHGTNI